ncbi:hypothetical protein F783_009040 [Bordetella holmesii F627]|nr:hypothetical protein F783_009040 [Bordetella holmesii F627]SUV91846.1 Uncharacterised protein [Bordetella holmesii]
MQIGRREGQRAKDQHAFEKYRHQHHAGPAHAQDAPRLSQKALPGRAALHEQSLSPLPAQLDQQAHADHEIAHHQNQKGAPPADGVCKQPPRQAARGHAQNGPGQKARQRGLAPLIRHVVTDPGHGQGHDARAGRSRQHAADHQHVQTVGHGRARTADGTGKRRHADHAVLAITIAHRAEEHLQQTVRHGKRRHGVTCLSCRGGELLRQLRQHGIANAESAGADESGQRQESDGSSLGMGGGHSD